MAQEILTSELDQQRNPRLMFAAAQFRVRMQKLVLGKPLTAATVLDAVDFEAHYRKQCKRQGVEFPELVPLVSLRLGILKFVYKHLDHKGIQATIINLKVEFPALEAVDIVEMINRAFPWYNPAHYNVEQKVEPIRHEVIV